MAITQEELERAGYAVYAAPEGEWRHYDERHPVPAYFDFDWFSSRHPDLYHAFALSTVGLMEELDRRVDLSGLDVLDVGGGTGRSTLALARKARRVTVMDVFLGAVTFGRAQARREGCRNVFHARGDCRALPLPENSFDACVSCWAMQDPVEAYRVLRPGGLLAQMGFVPGALCGELTAALAVDFPDLITDIGPSGWYDPACPPREETLAVDTWQGLPVLAPPVRYDFTYVADYGDPQEAEAILGRLYGPTARRYMQDRRQSTLAWRLRIEMARVKK